MTRRWLATAAVAGPALSVALVALLHALKPETNDTEAISEYALGDYGFLMNAAFVAAAVGFAALAGALAGRVVPTWSARAAIVLLVAAAVGWLLLGAGNIDPEGAEQTTHGVIHGIGFLLGFPSMFLALLLLGRAFGRDERCRRFRRPLLAVTVAAFVAFVLAFIDVAAGAASARRVPRDARGRVDCVARLKDATGVRAMVLRGVLSNSEDPRGVLDGI